MSAKKYDPTTNSLLINVNRQISREIDKNHIDNNDNDKPNINQQNKNSPDSTNTSHSSSPRFNYNSTLNKRQQSWVDPLEPRIHDTFYHKKLDTLRPRYSLLLKKHGSVDAMFEPNINNKRHSCNTKSSSYFPDRSHTPSWEQDNTLQEIQQNFGVIMFLRMGWMVGQSGILLSIIIILLCSSVTFITTLSMSAIATNGRIEGGGLYYMISRSLGPSFGGTVGLLFGVGNAIATSFKLDLDSVEELMDISENNTQNNSENDSSKPLKRMADSLTKKVKNNIFFGSNHRSNSQLDLNSEPAMDLNSIGAVSYIDVWWLIDDGGLTVLLPYIMKLHKFWSKCKLRLNIIANSNVVSEEYLNVYHLMNQFRLPYESPNLIEVDGKNEQPNQKTMDRFHQLTDNQINFENDLMRPKVIKKWLKVSELIHKYSNQSQVILLTLPLPTRFYKYDDDENNKQNINKNQKHNEYLNAKVYFAILEMLTESGPPIILIRGNGQSALTFYSE